MCEKHATCNAYAAIEYREFYKKRKKELDRKYYCEEMKMGCNKNCPKNKICTESVHKNYRRWQKAYGSNNKKELMKLSVRE